MSGATENDLAAAFEEHRPHLLRVAYATTSSWAAAEDCVQETWLRLERTDVAEIRDLRAWLTTAVGRIALDQLGSARARRERYVGTWLPEPVVEPAPDAAGADPADRVTMDESVGLALLVVLERLSPAQRVAYLMHDVFGLSFDEIATMVGRSPAAVRKLASRARRDVRAAGPRRPAGPDEQREVADAFSAACLDGDLARLVALLDADVELRSDGGGLVSAVRQVQRGAEGVARILIGFARQPPLAARRVLVNGDPGMLLRSADGVLTVLFLEIDDGRVVAVDMVRNPDKLRHLADDLLG
ncbi:RNA polymerase sigma-70 factor (ECF subfamily) [Mumia flava]|uniref:RNA polymerase sigma-70 factor (ECF subfamily) n=1 Tax=Mumia flava TaxID=1348852 RepID=A0A0B2B725_9ACTN|nr:RNA polymerase sigma factor SigJ [Mumia flava]PJJ57816.1 RNA polymerase sigma-70 factor (ECF subfamily) [Mumia flava]